MSQNPGTRAIALICGFMTMWAVVLPWFGESQMAGLVALSPFVLMCHPWGRETLIVVGSMGVLWYFLGFAVPEDGARALLLVMLFFAGMAWAAAQDSSEDAPAVVVASAEPLYRSNVDASTVRESPHYVVVTDNCPECSGAVSIEVDVDSGQGDGLGPWLFEEHCPVCYEPIVVHVNESGQGWVDQA